MKSESEEISKWNCNGMKVMMTFAIGFGSFMAGILLCYYFLQEPSYQLQTIENLETNLMSSRSGHTTNHPNMTTQNNGRVTSADCSSINNNTNTNTNGNNDNNNNNNNNNDGKNNNININTKEIDSYSPWLLSSMIKWSLSPNSMCYGNKNSDIVITTISALHRHFEVMWQNEKKISHKFLFFKRLNSLIYVSKHNYIYCEFDDTLDTGKSAHYSKFNALRLLLHYYKHVIWADLDTMFHIGSQSIETKFDINNDNDNIAFKLVSSHKKMSALYNGGVMCVQHCCNSTFETSINILDEASAFPLAANPTFEQVAMNQYILKNEEIDAHKYIKILDNEVKKIQHYRFSKEAEPLIPYKSYKAWSNKDKKMKFEYLVWHFTGDDNRYEKLMLLMALNCKYELINNFQNENVKKIQNNMLNIDIKNETLLKMLTIDTMTKEICDKNNGINNIYETKLNEKECIEFLDSNIKPYYPKYHNARKQYKQSHEPETDPKKQSTILKNLPE